MSDLLQPKQIGEFQDEAWGLCLWKLPVGGFIANINDEYLCSQGKVGDKMIELKMRAAAKNCGVELGEPFWLPGFRKVSQSEWEDQMAELLDGGTPDPVDI